MKLNKKMIMLCIWVLSLLMTGCSAENSEKDTHNKETKGNEPQTVKIDEVDWNIDENIVDEKRCVVLDYTNNSNCTIVDFELSFKAKNDITDKEKEKFYQDIQKSFEFSDDDMSELKEKEISMSTGSERVVNPGESVDKARCYYYSGYYYLNLTCVECQKINMISMLMHAREKALRMKKTRKMTGIAQIMNKDILSLWNMIMMIMKLKYGYQKKNSLNCFAAEKSKISPNFKFDKRLSHIIINC